MNKHTIRIEIGQILDNRCGPCPVGGSNWKHHGASRLVKECYTCPHYKKLRQLGRLLESGEREMTETLTVEKFVTWKKAGLLIKAIANKVGKSPSNVSTWARYHKNEINAEMAKQRKKPGPKTGQAIKYRSVNTDDEKDRQIAALIRNKKELANRIENLEKEVSTGIQVIKNLKKKLTETQSSLNFKAKCEADALKKVRDLQEQLELSRNENNRIKRENSSLKNQYSELLKQRDIALNLIHVMTDA